MGWCEVLLARSTHRHRRASNGIDIASSGKGWPDLRPVYVIGGMRTRKGRGQPDKYQVKSCRSNSMGLKLATPLALVALSIGVSRRRHQQPTKSLNGTRFWSVHSRRPAHRRRMPGESPRSLTPRCSMRSTGSSDGTHPTLLQTMHRAERRRGPRSCRPPTLR